MAADGPGGGAEPLAWELADAFSRAGKVLTRKFDEHLGEGGVSTPRSRVLVEVARLGPARVTDIASAVGIAQGTASTLLEALVRDGLVTRSEDPSDRRVTRVIATPKGIQQSQSWLRAYRAAADELFSVLPRSRWADLIDMMSIIGGQD